MIELYGDTHGGTFRVPSVRCLFCPVASVLDRVRVVVANNDLRRRNGKNAERSGSGKFVTVCPDGEQELAALLGDLEPRLAGRAGAYIRIGAGPLHVRYGGFRPMWTDVAGCGVYGFRARPPNW
ncbi:hypothetical protein KOI35_26200 [Actinoplanes bogorensis]|uniref:RamC N-terminal domain-containing protein n=1 Tax=Paractinoplanes bogorensis TaxID=1610840 RepID=A0ABS5YWB9_9ACTN|nr:hypothetical protein [Actinoplanes bogorensis]MBU2667009.1 hypothetical protein [Actinoplanes bogorensis]